MVRSLKLCFKKDIRATGVLNFRKHTFPIYILITTYNTRIFSQFNYWLLSWGANSNMLFYLLTKDNGSKTCNHANPIFKTLQPTRFIKIENLSYIIILLLPMYSICLWEYNFHVNHIIGMVLSYLIVRFEKIITLNIARRFLKINLKLVHRKNRHSFILLLSTIHKEWFY